MGKQVDRSDMSDYFLNLGDKIDIHLFCCKDNWKLTDISDIINLKLTPIFKPLAQSLLSSDQRCWYQ